MASPTQSQSQSTELHLFDYLRVIQVRWPFIVMIFLLVVITTGVITYLMPKQYESTAIIQVQQNSDFEIFQQGSMGRGWDPRFATTQFEIIQSRQVLKPVIDKLGLVQRWAEEYEIKSPALVERKLRSMLRLREVRNTDLISISILGPDKQEASDIANAIAASYQQARILEQQEWVGKSLESLESEVEKQRRKTEDLRQAAAEIRVKYGINDLNPESVEEPLQASERVLLTVEEQVSQQRLLAASARARYDQLSQMTDDQILRSIATLQVQDQTILQILPLYQEVASEEARLMSAGLGEQHPNVAAQRAKRAKYWEQLTDQITSLRVALQANLAIEEAALTNLESQLKFFRDEQQDSRTNAADYNEAKNSYIQAKTVLEGAEVRFWTEMMQRSMPMNPAIIWTQAEPAEFPSRPILALNLALGVFFGLVLGLGSAFFIEYMDTSVKTMEDIEKFFDLPVLAVVPKSIGILMDEPEDTVHGEPYRILRTNIEFNRKSADLNSMTLVSGGPGEGKSTTLVNLAFTFAQSGMKTIIVDADLRRPTQHAIFDVSNSKGLTDYLSKGIQLDDLIKETKVENLSMIPSGKLPAGAVAMLNSRRMTDLISDLKSRFDMVLIDAPPILGVSDSSVIARAVDLTVIVIQHRRFPRSMLIRVKNAVLNAGGNLLGAVLNNVDVRLDQYYEYQTNYSGYYHKPTQEEEKATKVRKKEIATQAAAGEPPLVSSANRTTRTNGRDEY